MLKNYCVIFYLVLISTNNVYFQDKIAKTDKGQIIILNKDGTWLVKDSLSLLDNKAITIDGRLVLLARDGKWFFTDDFVRNPSQQQRTNAYVERNYSSSSGTFTIPYSSATVTGSACVHVPPNTKSNGAEPRPFMMLLDPSGNAASIVDQWQTAADRFGWIIASTPAIMNGTDSSQNLQHLLALLDAVAETWSVDRHAVILEGFSGGGCAAYRQVLMHPDLFRGAIVECGHMGPYLDLKDQIRPGSCFFLVTRSQDFNAQHMRDLAKALEECGETVKLIELQGGHESIRGVDADDALKWINSMIK